VAMFVFHGVAIRFFCVAPHNAFHSRSLQLRVMMAHIRGRRFGYLL